MAVIKGRPYVVRYIAWDTSTTPWSRKTGDAANHTVYVDIDGGTSSAVAVTITEIDSVNRPGEYKFTLPGTYTDGNSIGISIKSSTAGVFIQPKQLLTEQGRVDAAISTRASQTTADAIKAQTDKMNFTGTNINADVKVMSTNATVGGYAVGQSPGEQVLVTPANKLTTDISGRVTVGDYAATKSPAEQVLATPANKLATDISGRVTVGSYATGQSPAEQVLVTPANKLATDASGRVTVGTNADKSGYALASGEYSNIASAVWSAASRTLTSFGTLVSDVASAVWSYTTRTLTALGSTLADEVWNRLRSATSRPVGSFGYYLDAQVSSVSGGGGGGGSGFIGPRTITFQVHDAANQPVPGALVVVHGVGAALTNASGQLVVDMPEGAFTVSVVGKDGLLFDSQTTPATGDATLQFIGYTRVPPTATDPGTCVVYVDVTASCSGTLTIVELPRKLSGGKWLVGQTQQKSSSAGRITFDAVPWGATVRVVVPAAKVDTTFVVPEASSYAV